jgi:hypothetical protein
MVVNYVLEIYIKKKCRMLCVAFFYGSLFLRDMFDTAYFDGEIDRYFSRPSFLAVGYLD